MESVEMMKGVLVMFRLGETDVKCRGGGGVVVIMFKLVLMQIYKYNLLI